MNIRRVVTGHDDDGVAKAVLDDTGGPTVTGKSGKYTVLWRTDAVPAAIPLGEFEDTAAAVGVSPFPSNGSTFLIIEYAPGNHGTMHRTETVDYMIVLSGTIEMLFDDSSVTLNAGDVIVQRGTNHAWRNTGTVPVRVAVILLAAEPLAIGHPMT